MCIGTMFQYNSLLEHTHSIHMRITKFLRSVSYPKMVEITAFMYLVVMRYVCCSHPAVLGDIYWSAVLQTGHYQSAYFHSSHDWHRNREKVRLYSPIASYLFLLLLLLLLLILLHHHHSFLLLHLCSCPPFPSSVLLQHYLQNQVFEVREKNWQGKLQHPQKHTRSHIHPDTALAGVLLLPSPAGYHSPDLVPPLLCQEIQLDVES